MVVVLPLGIEGKVSVSRAVCLLGDLCLISINRISGHQRNIGVISAYRRVHKQVLTALFLAEWRFE